MVSCGFINDAFTSSSPIKAVMFLLSSALATPPSAPTHTQTPSCKSSASLTVPAARHSHLPHHFNSIQFHLYSAITIQLSLGALQSPEPETPLVQAQWQHGQEKTPCMGILFSI